jgi:hypothetical protein
MLTPDDAESWYGSHSNRTLTTKVWVLFRTVLARFMGDNTTLSQFFFFQYFGFPTLIVSLHMTHSVSNNNAF